MSNITQYRAAYKPFEYQWAYDYWFEHLNARWAHHTISMTQDIKDWHENLTEPEKNVVSNILKGFAITETFIGNYWLQYVPRWFPKHEIVLMAGQFGAGEGVHAVAYNYLEETLGLENYDAFLKDKTTMNKLDSLINVDPNDESLENIARSLAIFSACAEGIQLFSSFAVMLSFKKTNRMKGISQQMVYSIRDESMHSEAGCRLFRTLIDENPEIWTPSLKVSIHQGIELALSNEFDYIDKIFELGDLESITKAELKNFMHDRANRKLTELGLEPSYDVDEQLLRDMSWFYSFVSGQKDGDFFDIHQTDYSEPNGDWNDTEDLF